MGNNPNNSPRRSLGNIINRVFESAGPEGKVRGTPQQIIDKYQALARDAQVAGDRVTAESFLQHSEHYSRLLGEAQAQQQEARQAYEREEPRRDELYEQPRHQPQPPRQPQPQPQPFASGLAMIDTSEDDENSGLIDTPENGGGLPPRQEPPAEAAANGSHHPAADAPAAEEPREAAPAPKRPRTRRKAPRPEEEPADASQPE